MDSYGIVDFSGRSLVAVIDNESIPRTRYNIQIRRFSNEQLTPYVNSLAHMPGVTPVFDQDLPKATQLRRSLLVLWRACVCVGARMDELFATSFCLAVQNMMSTNRPGSNADQAVRTIILPIYDHLRVAQGPEAMLQCIFPGVRHGAYTGS
jgi:hypothetical protein